MISAVSVALFCSLSFQLIFMYTPPLLAFAHHPLAHDHRAQHIQRQIQLAITYASKHTAIDKLLHRVLRPRGHIHHFAVHDTAIARITHMPHDVQHPQHIIAQVESASARTSDQTCVHHFFDRAACPRGNFFDCPVSRHIFFLLFCTVHCFIYILPEPIHRQAEWLPQVLRVGVCACYTAHTSLGMADNYAVSQGVKTKLGTKLCKQLNSRSICAPNMGFCCLCIKIAPLSAITGVGDRCRLRHLDADVRAVCAAAAVPCLYSPRQCLIYFAIPLHKSMDAYTLPVWAILIKILRHHRRVGLRHADAVQHQPLRAQRRTYLIALVPGREYFDDVHGLSSLSLCDLVRFHIHSQPACLCRHSVLRDVNGVTADVRMDKLQDALVGFISGVRGYDIRRICNGQFNLTTTLDCLADISICSASGLTIGVGERQRKRDSVVIHILLDCLVLHGVGRCVRHGVVHGHAATTCNLAVHVSLCRSIVVFCVSRRFHAHQLCGPTLVSVGNVKCEVTASAHCRKSNTNSGVLTERRNDHIILNVRGDRTECVNVLARLKFLRGSQRLFRIQNSIGSAAIR
nr:MAG TPA: hypothetical protein [Caudoviricetes sp.]